MNKVCKYYVLKNNEDKYFTFDDGYPYFTDDIRHRYIYHNDSIEEMKAFLTSHYCTKRFPNKFKDIKIMEIVINEKEVEVSK